ncbi:MAG: hypothetical protein HYW33_00995 [Candidatus Blackburnbacteria bacterium]|nr:hypothetical protein [Candidatus Blackburnbacteria bacterium]
MKWFLDVNDRPFNALKSGKKKIETRTFVTVYESPDYRQMKNGDILTFENNQTKERITMEILGVRHYKDVSIMFDAEGQENCMSYDAPREEAIDSYNQLKGYTEGIKKNGIYAIEVRPVKNE